MPTLYLWINIGTLLFPLLFSFDKKVAFFKQWPYLFPAIIITGGLFLVWDQLFTLWQVWGFNRFYITGYYIFDLPIEEIMFFFTVPYACVFIYECLKVYIKKDLLEKVHRYITLVVVLGSATLIYYYNRQLYTSMTALLLLLIAGVHLIVIKRRYMSHFYLAYFVCLIPMAVVNGILTAKPVVIYNESQTVKLRIGSIPAEDFLYNMLLLLLCISLFEMFRRWGLRYQLSRRKRSS